MFFIAFFVLGLACSIVSIKTLIGYGELKRFSKIIISFLIVWGWMAPLIVGLLEYCSGLSPVAFKFLSISSYALMGFVFVVFCLLLLRDIIWYSIYGVAKLLRVDNWSVNPKNLSMLKYANRIVIGVSLLICIYAFYQGGKIPDFNTIVVESSLLKKDIRIVQLSDLHIDRTTSINRIKKIVEKVNSVSPDVIVMTGDITDDSPIYLDTQLAELMNLKAPYGVFISIGNHEFYNGLSAWLHKYHELGFKVLFNKGETVDNNVFISGIPDVHTANSEFGANINFKQALEGSHTEQYRILLSHNPEMADSVTGINYQMILSGHTHGGQIFPFHYFVKKANKYLSGDYNVNGIKLHVSSGAGTWGPSMRLFAPSEIAIIDLLKK